MYCAAIPAHRPRVCCGMVQSHVSTNDQVDPRILTETCASREMRPPVDLYRNPYNMEVSAGDCVSVLLWNSQLDVHAAVC